MDASADSGASSPIARRLFLVKALTPPIGLSLGVDGGDVFQIIAVDTLLIRPGAIGAALGLGTLSVPLQIWAARIPLRRARHNIRLFMWSMGVMSLVAAVVVAWAEPGSLAAQTVLPLTILAELSVSVLFATSMQPLIGYTLSSHQRQNLLGRTSAVSGTIIFALVFVVGQVGPLLQASLLTFMGMTSLALGWALRILPPPPPPVEDEPEAVPANPTRSRMLIYLMFVGSGLAGLPLVLTYIALVMWPTGNLGVVGAALAVGVIIPSALWRDVGQRLNGVLVTAAVAVSISVIVLVSLPNPVGLNNWSVTAMLTVAVSAVASLSVFRIAAMEYVHRQVDQSNMVRVMTLIDVVGSTSAQLGLFAAGVLIEATRSGRVIVDSFELDPYRLWLVVGSLLLVTSTLLLVSGSRRPTESSESAGRSNTG